MHIEAVIGANYGDEGKGLFTEYLCRNRPNPLVVLSNGGCQRGHTVNNAGLGIRHVFHHFGSGTLVGAPSVYSKSFLLNPIKYVEEKKELENAGIEPKVFRVPSCLLQLPGDMFINQMAEKARSATGKQHGSCGWGIWETICRNNQHRVLTFEDFASKDYEAKRRCILEEIEWQVANRLRPFYNEYAINWKVFDLIASDGFCKHFIDDFNEMYKDCKCLESDNLLDVAWEKHNVKASTLVVENGQGLLLDKQYAPKDENGRTDVHTTPSNTGFKGVEDAIGKNIQCCKTTANYISRTYFTRHGAGPFPEYSADLSFIDNTNVFNEYQGQFKFGKMNYSSALLMLHRIMLDCATQAEPTLVLTHCNEMDPNKLVNNVPMLSYLSYTDNSKEINSIY